MTTMTMMTMIKIKMMMMISGKREHGDYF